MAQINIKKTDTLQTPTSGLAGVGVKQSNELFIVDENGQEIPVGGGLYGTQYVFVTANGTDTENATELQSAYNTAKTMSPSSTNRITVVVGMGNYDFGSSSFDMDTEYIDLVSLDGNRSVVLNATLNTSDRTEGSINMTANNVFVKGVDVGEKKINTPLSSAYQQIKLENCKGGDYSFGGFENSIPVESYGTYINCEGGDYSFGANTGASGNYIGCKGGDFSFGYFGTASGTFTDCQGGEASFGGNGGTASGTFTNCVGGDESFGGFGTASGTFTNSVGGDYSFGGFSTASGTFNNCQAGNGSFGGNGTLNGKLYYCRITLGTFQTVSSGGVTRLCIDGNNNENNQG